MMKPRDWSHADWAPVLRGTTNSTVMIRAAASAARPLASTTCSMPSTSTTRQAPTRKNI